MTVWREVEDALEAIIDEYIRMNHIISLFQDDKVRREGLERAGTQEGVTLELGSGPGNFTKMLREKVRGPIVCLDYSTEFIPVARVKNLDSVHFLRGIFEALPLRDAAFHFAAAAYALRDSIDKPRAFDEIRGALRAKGKLLMIDIGKPNNPIIRGLFNLYMRFMVPIMAGIAAGRGPRNPWSTLYKTYELLPVNKELQEMLEQIIGRSEVQEKSFGGLMIGVAEKKKS